MEVEVDRSNGSFVMERGVEEVRGVAICDGGGRGWCCGMERGVDSFNSCAALHCTARTLSASRLEAVRPST